MFPFLRVRLSAKDSKRLSDFASHLKRYIAYRLNSVDTVADRVQFVIKHYKEHFDSVNKEERYKWEALGWYKKHWNIEAENFATMLETAFRQDKFVNLLAANMYWPYKMAVEFAKKDPETVRSLFRVLYDESIPLAERYTLFRNGFSEQYKSQELNHYQDLHAVSVYLSCEYPEKYFIYKSTIYTTMRDRIGFVEGKSTQKSVVWKVESYAQMCNLILAEISQDLELIEMHQARLDDFCYKDELFHLLAMDIVYYGSSYMTDDDFKHRPIEKSDTIYWPSLEEYDPGITKETWISVLKDSEITTPENLDMLKKMLELGGESTCAHLAEVYGNVHSYYNALGSTYGKRVYKKLGCPECYDSADGVVRYFPIPFQVKSCNGTLTLEDAAGFLRDDR